LEEFERKSGAGMILFIIFLIAFVGFIGYKYFRVAKIEVEGNVNLDSSYVATLSGIVTDENLFAINDDKVADYINSDPYLEFFDLKRIYPSTVRIEVYERIPVALIIGSSNNYIVDKEGNVLESTNTNEYNLVTINGILLSSAVPGEKLLTQNAYDFDALVNIIRDVKYNELLIVITKIDLSDINNIKMVTKEGINISFGQAERVSEKIVWINAVLKELEEKGITKGKINVTSGDFATYTEK
jgi:cell division protein FtsQ